MSASNLLQSFSAFSFNALRPCLILLFRLYPPLCQTLSTDLKVCGGHVLCRRCKSAIIG